MSEPSLPDRSGEEAGLRVVHVLGELRPSGAEVMLECTRPLWSEAGVDPSIVAWGAQVGPHADALIAAGYGVDFVPNRRSLGSVLQLVRRIRQLRPNVVHVHTETMSFWVLLALRLSLPGSGLVRTVHNSFPYEGGLRLRRLVQRQLLSRVGVVYVAVSPTVRANEADRFRLHCHLIWNWVDVSAFSGVRLRSDGPAVRPIAMVGNCAPYKRHALGLRAFARLDHKEIRLVHAGLEEPARPERALAEDLGVADRVDFVGYVRAMPELIAESSLLLLPSEREGLPLVVGEALVAGVPVVATDVEGTRDYAWSPLLFLCEGTPDSLAEGVMSVLDHPPTEAERVDASREAQTRLSPRRGVADYTDVYRHLRSWTRVRPR